MTTEHDDRLRALRDALAHLQAALDLLDRAGAPAQIGAHIDLARHELASHAEVSGKDFKPTLQEQTRH